MAVQTISYANKSYINQNTDIADTNKVNDTDMNEIKSVVNNNATILSGLVGQILWTNPNPTVAITSTNITLSSSDYDVLEIFYRSFINNTISGSIKIPKGDSIRIATPVGDGYSYRSMTYSSDTSYAIGEDTVSNNRNIPTYVIGYKTGLF